MRQTDRILSNAAAVGASQILLLVPSLIIVPYLIGTLGDDGYGIYVLIWSLFTAIIQLQNSLQSGVVKYSAAFLSQGRVQNANRVASSSLAYSIILGILAFIAILSITLTQQSLHHRWLVAVVVALLALFTIPCTPYVGIIQAKQRYEIEAAATTVTRYAMLAMVVLWFNVVEPSAAAAIIIMGSSLLVSRLIQAPMAYHLISELRVSLRLFEWDSFRSVFVFGAATVVASVCLAANTTGVRWLMGAIVSTGFVGRMAIMLMPGFMLTRILGSMTSITMPAASAYNDGNDYKNLGRLFVGGVRYMSFLTIPAIITAGLLMKDVLVLWVGPAYAFLAPYALIVVVSRGVLQCTSTAHHILKGIGRLRTVVVTYAAGLVLVPLALILPINVATANPYLAVTAGLSAGYLVSAMWQMIACIRAVRTTAWFVARDGFLQPLALGVPIAAIAVGLQLFVPSHALLERVGLSAALAILFLALSYRFGLSASERAEITRLKDGLQHRFSRLLGSQRV